MNEPTHFTGSELSEAVAVLPPDTTDVDRDAQFDIMFLCFLRQHANEPGILEAVDRRREQLRNERGKRAGERMLELGIAWDRLPKQLQAATPKPD